MLSIGRVSSQRAFPLTEGWRLVSSPSGGSATPADINWDDSLPAQVPGTAASALLAAGRWTLDTPRDFDLDDWWFECRFGRPAVPDGSGRWILTFEGLATLAEVWLNGAPILTSANMFLQHDVDVTAALTAENILTLRFRSLKTELTRRRPRPRWKTKLVEHQQLRWIRTTLLGRIPGWSPPVAAAGPWRPVLLSFQPGTAVVLSRLHSSLEGTTGVVAGEIEVTSTQPLASGTLHIGDASAPLAVQSLGGGRYRLAGGARVDGVQLWWPSTHGAQPLYLVSLQLNTGERIELGRTGFRRLEYDMAGGGFGLIVNGVSIFCRGACWTICDITTLAGTPAQYRTALTLARDAGMNMLRIGGTMVYESALFYDLCDELGILVWQDFMFANLDYPAADEEFAMSVQAEADQFMARLQLRPCLAVCCGNSEVEQQAAMLGVPGELWRNSLFAEILPSVVRDHRPELHYWPSSPSGGTLPFHVNAGIGHYYGVGAYLRPVEDARRAAVKFTTECLGFANVPDPDAVEALLPNGESPIHHPRWKSRTPRDFGAGWDFEDVRDHYLQTRYGVDPMRLRYSNMDRYLALSRLVTGDLMSDVLTEWRRPASGCRGALVWFHQDLWLGAGWGLLDSSQHPKAAYRAFRRAMRPVALGMTDEGVNGLQLHLFNDTAQRVEGILGFRLVRDGHVVTAEGSQTVALAPRSSVSLSGEEVLATFSDTSYAYRFGPPGFAVAAARFTGGGEVLDAFAFPAGAILPRETDLGLVARLAPGTSDVRWLDLSTDRFAQAIAIDIPGWEAEDSHFHLAPGWDRRIRLRPLGELSHPARGSVVPLNGVAPVHIIRGS